MSIDVVICVVLGRPIHCRRFILTYTERTETKVSMSRERERLGNT